MRKFFRYNGLEIAVVVLAIALFVLLALAAPARSEDKGLRKPPVKTATAPEPEKGDLLMEFESEPDTTEKKTDIASGQNTDAKSAQSYSFEVSIPLFVKMLGVLAALVGFVLFIQWLRRGAAGSAVAATVDFGDELLRKRIAAMKARADTATAMGKPAEAKDIMLDVADLGDIRGKLASKAPAKKVVK
jgi:hypothetical protein